MTWAEYEWQRVGYERRLERGFDQVRHLMASMHNFSGFAKKSMNPREMMPLYYLDYKPKVDLVERVSNEAIERMNKNINLWHFQS